jgi:hypothetical protein
MVATPDDELTEQDILRRAASEQERADLLKRRGFIEAAILRGKEVTELIEIARVTNVSERIDRIRLIYRQRSRDKKRDPLFASSYAVKGWKAHRTTQESRLRRAKSTEEKIDAEAQIGKYDLVIARAEGYLALTRCAVTNTLWKLNYSHNLSETVLFILLVAIIGAVHESWLHDRLVS